MYAHPPARVGSAPPYPYPAHTTDASTPTDRSLSPDLSAMFDKGFLKTPRAAARSPRPKRRARPVQVDYTASPVTANVVANACWAIVLLLPDRVFFCSSVCISALISTLPAYTSAIHSKTSISPIICMISSLCSGRSLQHGTSPTKELLSGAELGCRGVTGG